MPSIWVKMFTSALGLLESNQKNHDNPEAEVSLPARMKLITISRRNRSEGGKSSRFIYTRWEEMRRFGGSDCLAFRPERFLRGGVFVAPNPYDYPVFLGGPRMCLGMDMGMMQMKLIGASLISRYKFVVREGANPDLSVTMKIVGGLPIHVRRRKG